jgi:hypothetical protein
MNAKKITTASVAAGLLLVSFGAAIYQDSSESAVDKQAAPALKVNEWVAACESYEYSADEGYLKAYEEVIFDVCSKADPSLRSAPFTLSPTVDVDDAMRYIDAEKFHESYWLSYMNPEFPEKIRIVFSENDQKWWEEQMVENILNPDLGWFTSQDEGGHCRVEATIFCPEFFEPKLTTANVPTEFRIIGSQLAWENWQVINSAHEAVHLYQDSYGMSHWAIWYVEGQATFFELAMAQLIFKSESIRTEFLKDRPARGDTLLLTPETVEDVIDFLESCNKARQECNEFKLGGGSLFHEKLVIDHGLTKYFEWQKYLIDRMPMGNPGDFNAEESLKAETTFNQSFIDVFGVDRKKWEEESVAPYLLEYYG